MAGKNKSYLNNPALQFISSAIVDEAIEKESTPEKAAPAQPARAAAAVEPLPEKQAAPIKAEEPIAAPKPAFEVPMKPVYVEVRSKRFNALMQPTLYRNLSALAAQAGVSVNELMHQILSAYVQEHM